MNALAAVGHECARRGCSEIIPKAFMFCPADWALVPDRLKSAIYAAWGFGHPESTPKERLAIFREAVESVPPKEAA